MDIVSYPLPPDADAGPLFAAARVQASRTASSRGMDMLARHLSGFQNLPRRPALRKGHILAMLRQLAEIDVPGAEDKQAKLRSHIEQFEAHQIDEAHPIPEDAFRLESDRILTRITNAISDMRSGIALQRKGYEPGKRMQMINDHHTRGHIKFLRELVAAYEADLSDPAKAAMLARLPALSEELETARHQLATYTLTNHIAEVLKRYCPHPGKEFHAQEFARNAEPIRAALEIALDEYRPNMPQKVNWQPTFTDALETVRAAPSIEALRESYKLLRFQPCQYARYLLEHLDTAYRKDVEHVRENPGEAEALKRDAQALPAMPQTFGVVARARWALAADQVFALTDRNFSTMLNPRVAPDINAANSHIEALRGSGGEIPTLRRR